MAHVVIVGAGPAGASLAYLLAQRNIEVTLLERRKDFAREFRGEILMPSGIEAIRQMGLTDALTNTPNHGQQNLAFYFNGKPAFSERLDPTSFGEDLPLAFSQTVFLENVVKATQTCPGFTFERGISVRSINQVDGQVTGVTVRDEQGERELIADLVIGADGRNSFVRRHLDIPSVSLGAPMDIVWCKLPCPDDWQDLRAYVSRGHLLVTYHTWDDTLQLGWVILKGQFSDLRSGGIEAWVEEMANHVSSDLATHLRANIDRLQKPFLLESVSDCVKSWSQPGALLIGDAAHTMSPVGGQGVNIALRDAIVAANHLVPILKQPIQQTKLQDALQSIEKTRMLEIGPIQRLQARPPQLVLSRAWWGEPIRRLAAMALSKERIRHRAASRARAFAYGITEVQLEV